MKYDINADPQTSEQIEALKAIMKVLKIEFKITRDENYDPELVSKINESLQQVKEGKVTIVNKEDLEEFLSN